MTLRYAVVSATGGQGGAVTAALGDAGALLRGIARRLESLRAQERLSVHSVGRVLSGRTRYGTAMPASSKSPVTKLGGFFYERMRHKDAWSTADAEPTTGFASLAGHTYTLLITYRAGGEGVPSPVWFGRDEQDQVYFNTEEAAAKVKRIRPNPEVRLAPCDRRGKPLGPPAVGIARILDPGESEHAERTIAANYGLGRRLYEGMSARLSVSTVYVEVHPKR
jgi:uncharacterized protein